MAQFILSWDNTDAIANDNNLSQTASYRQKSVGGSWITAGFTPTNNIDKDVASALSPVLSPNLVYQFKIDCNCTQNGPSANDNGIREQIGFACIEPVIENTQTTSSINTDLTDTDITKVRYTLRKSSDNTIVYGPITVVRTGNEAPAVATSLVEGTEYYWQIVYFAIVNGVEVNSSASAYLNAVCGPHITITESAPVADLVWRADTVTCEKEGGFAVVQEIPGLSSPFETWYDDVNELVYVADNDDIAGNVYWFDPETATVAGDMIHSTAVNNQEYYNGVIDPIKRRIYFIGKPAGMRVYDIDTDTASTIAFGVLGAFQRVSMLLTPTHIIVYDVSIGSGAFVFINRDTLAIDTTLAVGSVPNNTRFAIGAFNMYSVGTEIWITAGSGSSVSSVGVYSADLLTNHANVTLTGAALWDGGRYWGSGYWDETSDHFYASDWGSSKGYVIDVATRTVLNTRTVVNLNGKSNGLLFWNRNPITDEIIVLVSNQNDSTDNTAVRKIYKENRVTYAYEAMYTDQSYYRLTRITGTNNLVGTLPGNPFWTGDPDYDTDGSITILSTSMGGDNTGRQIVLTLKEVDAANGDLPTGETKPNVIEDEDYIEPIEESEACEVEVNLDCPTQIATTFGGATLEYEFYIPNSVKLNPAINKIQVYARNTDTASNEGSPIEITAPFTANYYSGDFAGLGGSNYTIKVKYLDISATELQDC